MFTITVSNKPVLIYPFTSLSSNQTHYKVNKSMFVRLVRNIFSVVAGASVNKKCQVWEVAQRWPSLLVSYLEVQQSQTLAMGLHHLKDSNSTMMSSVGTTESIQIPWPIQMFRQKCKRSKKSQPLVRASGYCGFILYYTLGHVGGGNSCGGHTLMRVATTHAG
jgi:hypothetical protein